MEYWYRRRPRDKPTDRRTPIACSDTARHIFTKLQYKHFLLARHRKVLNRSRSQYILNSEIGVWVQHLQRSRRLPGRSSAQLAYPSAHHTVSFPGTRTPIAPNLSMYGEDKITQPACLGEYRHEAVQQVRAESNQPEETGRLSRTKPTDCGTTPQLRDKKKLDYIVPCPPPSNRPNNTQYIQQCHHASNGTRHGLRELCPERALPRRGSWIGILSRRRGHAPPQSRWPACAGNPSSRGTWS